MSACATVPQEAVELSYLIGRDMAALQQSYDLLLEQRFEDYRAQRTDYLENIWAPAFIAEWASGSQRRKGPGEAFGSTP